MTKEWVKFDRFVTKGITVESGDERRIFKGHITAEIIDQQQEFIFVKEVMGIMENFMSVNPVISDFHSNRMVGRVLSYEKSEYQGVATVMITGEVYKKDGVTLYDKVWDKVVKGEYSGLSMGGASKEREPIEKDGRMALELRKLELYEIALCDTPANPFAVIEEVNKFAKANGLDQKMIKEANGREYIQCTSLQCKFEKGTDMDSDIDIDNHKYKCDGGDKCDICKKSKEEHGIEQFDKPEEEIEKLDNSTIVNRSAEQRAENVGGSTGSPKETNDVLNSIPKAPSAKFKKDTTISTTMELTPEEQKARMEGRTKDQTSDKTVDLEKQAVPEDVIKDEEVEKDGSIVAKLPHVAGTRKQTLVEGNSNETTSNRRVKDLTKKLEYEIRAIYEDYK